MWLCILNTRSCTLPHVLAEHASPTCWETPSRTPHCEHQGWKFVCFVFLCCAACWLSGRWKIVLSINLWTDSLTKINAIFWTNYVQCCCFHNVVPFLSLQLAGKKGLLCSQCEQRPAASGGLSCWLPWLMESLGTDRAVHLVWPKRLVARPPCLFSFYSGRRITAKKAAKQAVKGLLKSSKGIRGESFTSTEQQQTPVVHVGESCRG